MAFVGHNRSNHWCSHLGAIKYAGRSHVTSNHPHPQICWERKNYCNGGEIPPIIRPENVILNTLPPSLVEVEEGARSALSGSRTLFIATVTVGVAR